MIVSCMMVCHPWSDALIFRSNGISESQIAGGTFTFWREPYCVSGRPTPNYAMRWSAICTSLLTLKFSEEERSRLGIATPSFAGYVGWSNSLRFSVYACLGCEATQ